MFEWNTPEPIRVVKSYVAAMNSRDAERVDALLDEHVRYVDSRGEWIEGRENVATATRRLFELDPEYKMHDMTIVMHEGDVLLKGRTSACEERLAHDTLWRARARGGKLTHWQSYGEDSPALARILMPEAARGAELR
ncbi:nuclear transport factor 2 family protein [Pelagerythrobacter marensis]|uniref:Nuclear transport factor 2 family protein n=1 Tax=Pelagerythrobacter marensis TaxID=543877 RepID=A0ABZ2D5K8_9SPHN